MKCPLKFKVSNVQNLGKEVLCDCIFVCENCCSTICKANFFLWTTIMQLVCINGSKFCCTYMYYQWAFNIWQNQIADTIVVWYQVWCRFYWTGISEPGWDSSPSYRESGWPWATPSRERVVWSRIPVNQTLNT